MYGLVRFLLAVAPCAHMVATIVVLIIKSELISSCSYLWGYCLMVGIVSFFAMFTDHGHLYRKSRLLGVNLAIPGYIAAIIWGAIILANISNECKSFYKNIHNLLWIFFLISFWYSVAYLALLIMCMIIGYTLYNRYGNEFVPENPTLGQVIIHNNTAPNPYLIPIQHTTTTTDTHTTALYPNLKNNQNYNTDMYYNKV